MNTYSFRAECIDDIKALQNLCVRKNIAFTLSVRPGILNMPDPPSDPECELTTEINLLDLQNVMREVVDGHVMIQTLRACPLSENTLERDYNLR